MRMMLLLSAAIRMPKVVLESATHLYPDESVCEEVETVLLCKGNIPFLPWLPAPRFACIDVYQTYGAVPRILDKTMRFYYNYN